jgi:hypothetical protein
MSIFTNTNFIKRPKIRLAGLVIIIISILFTAGCTTVPNPETTPTEFPREPFSARAVSEDGTIVEWIRQRVQGGRSSRI